MLDTSTSYECLDCYGPPGTLYKYCPMDKSKAVQGYKPFQFSLSPATVNWPTLGQGVPMVVHWHKLWELENERTLHISIILAICTSKVIVIKFGEDLMKFWQKQVGSFFWHTLYNMPFYNCRRTHHTCQLQSYETQKNTLRYPKVSQNSASFRILNTVQIPYAKADSIS